MRLPASLRSVRTLATATIVRRGAILAALALWVRLLTFATTWVLFSQPLAVKVVSSLTLGAVYMLRAFLAQSFGARTEAELTDRAIDSVLRGDVLRASVLPGEDAHAELGHGAYMSALQLSETLPGLVGDSVAVVVLTVVIACVEPARLLLGAVAVTIVTAIALMWSRSRLQGAARKAWALHEELQDAMVDALEGRLEIVASGERSAFTTRAHERANAWGIAGAKVAGSSLVSGRLPLFAIASAVALVATLDSRWQGLFAVSLANVALLASATPAFSGVAQGILAATQAEPWLRAVARVIDGVRAAPGHEPAPTMVLPVRFDAVSFRYDGADQDALIDIQFTWQDERVVALLGANGSGKSTWLRLLLALGAPRSGKIRVGERDLASLDADTWRRRIAFLPQRPYLPLRADVRATVRLLAPAASDERILSALERVGVLDALRTASTDPLAVRVDTLSVGQRQRVALARMLCRDASMFVLDEPDANLDRAGIALVAEIVQSLSREHRVLIAAHTPELVGVADRVIEMNQGRIARNERGRPGGS